MIWHLPHIHSIAAQSDEGAVSLLTKPRSQADKLFASDPAVKEVIWLERNPGRHDGLLGLLRLVARLRAGRFAHAWVLHGSRRYGLAVLLAGIPHSTGYARRLQRFILSEPVLLRTSERRGHAIAKADRLLAVCGVARIESEPRLRVNEAASLAIAAHYCHLPKPWIALAIGSSEPDRQWGRENFAELVQRLIQSGIPSLFLIGGEAERDMALWITKRVHRAGASLECAINLPLDQVAALLRSCVLCVGNDTGVFNMAAAVAVSTVGLFNGGYQPLSYSRFIHAVTPPPGHHGGMEAICVDRVLATVEPLMSITT